VTTVAAPLVAVGLAVESGQPWTIAELLVVAVLLVVTGPVLETATARVAAQQQGRIDPESPQ
jgi:multicomponent Na+:H+ antiporter subunit G